VRKLRRMGIRGTPLALFEDYLTGRRQKVKLGHYLSVDEEVSFGVPQGSVLGPTLFLIYINDLCSMKLGNAKILSYADDTAIIFTDSSWNSVQSSTNRGLAEVALWLRLNLLTLNPSKTNYICFSINNKTQPSSNFHIKIHKHKTCCDVCDCFLINRVSQVKYLGVIVDQRLLWYGHLEHLNGRLRKLTWIFKTLRHITPKPADITVNNVPSKNWLLKIYTSLVQSVLLYCIPIWGGTAKTQLLNVERAQRSLIKVMYFKKRRFPTEDLYQLCELLSVRKLYIRQVFLKTHTTLSYNPDILQKRRKDIIALSRSTKTAFAQSQYTSRSPFLYNKINKEIYLYDKTLKECKIILTNWLQPKSYYETETLLLHLA
jgi:hypothetical protein